MSEITTVGLDLAKRVVSLCGEDSSGREERTAGLNRLRGLLAECDRAIAQQARDDPRAVRVARLSGVGALTASALVATVVDAHQFRCGRQFAA